MSDHDLSVKASNVDSWLRKGYQVKVVIEMKGAVKVQRTREAIQEALLANLEQKYRIPQEPSKDEHRLMFQLHPEKQS